MKIFLILGVILLVILLGVGILLYFVNKAVRVVRNASNSIAGQVATHIAEEILDGDGAAVGDALKRPQEPRSISDMTSVYAPAIAKDFPDLNVNQLISSAESALISALGAIQMGSGGDKAAAMREFGTKKGRSCRNGFVRTGNIGPD